MKKSMIALLCMVGYLPAFGQVNAMPSGQWFASFLENRLVGFVHESYVTDGPESILRTTSKIVLTRSSTTAEVTLESEYIEDSKSGIIKSIRSQVKMSNQRTGSIFTNGPDSISLVQEMAGKNYLSKRPSQGHVYGPSWIKRRSIAALRNEGDTLDFKTYSPEFATYLRGRRKVVGFDQVKGIRTAVVEETYAEMPVRRKLWVTDRFDVLKMLDMTPFGPMESLATDEPVTLSDIGPVSFPAEFFNRTFAKSNVRLADARSIERITLKIVKRDGMETTIPDLNTEFQRTLETSNRYVVLEVRVPAMAVRPVQKAGLESDKLSEYLQPNALINSDDPEIVSIARQVTQGLSGDYEKCLALENWVTQNMTFDTGIVLAPASEVCRDRKGTCASYTTFLAALMRAAGIPARYNMGFVYMSGVWGGHAWPDAYVDGQWIPFDAAVNGKGSADAARFSFGVTSLKNGVGDLSAMAGGLLYGRVDVQVMMYTIREEEFVVSPGERPYEIKGDVYSNRVAAISLRKPADWQFANLDESWPDNTVVSVISAAGEKVSVLQTMAKPGTPEGESVKDLLKKWVPVSKQGYSTYKGKRIWKASSDKLCAVAIPRGQDVWLVMATGQRPTESLKKLLEAIDL